MAEPRPITLDDIIKMAVLGSIKEEMTNDLLAGAAREEEAADVHKQLARGYESTGAWPEEQRELIRCAYHQNQAIIYSNSAILLMLTNAGL